MVGKASSGLTPPQSTGRSDGFEHGNGQNDEGFWQNNKDDEEPSYSPDGKKIAYTVYNDSQGDIYTINAFGEG